MRAKKTKSGKWRCQLYLGDQIIDGRRKQIVKSFTAPTKAEAEWMANEYRRTAAVKPSEALTATLDTAIDKYIASRDRTLSPSTIRSYRSMKNGILSELLPLKLSEINSETLQSWINRHAHDRTAKTLKNCYALAVSSITAVDPSFKASVTFPPRLMQKTYVPTRTEIDTLIASETCEDMRKAILLAAYCSLRRSEACALTEADIDYAKGWIHINKAMVELADGHGFEIKPFTKTEESCRDVPAPSIVLEAMRTGSIKLTPTAVSRRFNRLVKRCGMPHIRYHDLRHFFASYLHAKNIPDAYIEKFGGWKQGSPVMRAIYREALKDEEQRQADKIVSLFVSTEVSKTSEKA